MENNNNFDKKMKDFEEDTFDLVEISDQISDLRVTFETGLTRDLKWRMQQLKQLLRMYEENNDKILDALYADMRKSKLEAYLYEVDLMKQDVRNHIRNLENWSRDELIGRNFLTITDKAYIAKDPYGVVLVLSAWNYPMQLALVPVAGAIAAGNCVVLKPSEVAKSTCLTIKDMVRQYLDPRAVLVVDCDGPQTESLLKTIRFDYIFYTGSQAVGKLIHSYANKHLTPVTLELGGKSPVYIDDTVDYKKTAERIMWGKCMNMGMTCVAPDYVLCSKNVEEKFIVECLGVLEEWYNSTDKSAGKRAMKSKQELTEMYRNGKTIPGNPNWQKAKDLARIINTRQFDRLISYIHEAKDGKGGKNLKPRIALGGEYDRSQLWIEPTIIVDASIDNNLKMMEEEIFGPILAIITVDSAEEAIQFINKYEHLRHPLCMYVFSDDRDVQLQFQNRTRTGTMAMNDSVIQFAVDEIPFGGIGNSGMGSYHGKFSFDTFTHRKGVVQRDFSNLGDKVGFFRYPPYTTTKINFLSFLLQHYKKFKIPSSELNSMGQEYGIVSNIILANPLTQFAMWLVCDVFQIAGHKEDRRHGLGFKSDYIFLLFLKFVEVFLFIGIGYFLAKNIF